MSLQGQSRHFEDPNEARRQTEGPSIKHRIQARFDAVARRPRARQPDDPAIRGRERPHFGAVEALPLPAPRRVASVDAVRGFTMFWIIGADGGAKALAEMLSGKGMIPSTAGNIIDGQFEHAEWEGLHFYDLIFPLFIFVTWNGAWDPEGLLSTLPAIAPCLLGVFAGLLLKEPSLQPHQKTLWLIGAGAAMIALGVLWGLQFPIVKNIWTSSYVLVCGGLSALLLGVFHQVIDAWE